MPNPGFDSQYYGELINNSMYSFPGVSDGGAHTKFLVGGSYTTDFLAWLVRDEQRVTLEEAHYRLSALPAFAAGFKNRGILREGTTADIVVYDLNKLKVTPDWIGEMFTISRPANGAVSSARKAIARSWSTVRSPLTKASARARPRASCCVTAVAKRN